MSLLLNDPFASCSPFDEKAARARLPKAPRSGFTTRDEGRLCGPCLTTIDEGGVEPDRSGGCCCGPDCGCGPKTRKRAILDEGAIQ